MEQDWGKEPWVFGEHGELYKGTPIHVHIKDAEGNFITSSDRRTFLPGYNWPRIIACVNACAGVPTDVLKTPGFVQIARIVTEIAYIGSISKEPTDAD